MASLLSSSRYRAANLKMVAGINPFEVCSGDAIGHGFDQAFHSASIATAFRAGSVRVRWDCENDDDHEYGHFAFRSRIANVGFNHSDGDAIDRERSRGEFGAIYGNG